MSIPNWMTVSIQEMPSCPDPSPRGSHNKGDSVTICAVTSGGIRNNPPPPYTRQRSNIPLNSQWRSLSPEESIDSQLVYLPARPCDSVLPDQLRWSVLDSSRLRCATGLQHSSCGLGGGPSMIEQYLYHLNMDLPATLLLQLCLALYNIPHVIYEGEAEDLDQIVEPPLRESGRPSPSRSGVSELGINHALSLFLFRESGLDMIQHNRYYVIAVQSPHPLTSFVMSQGSQLWPADHLYSIDLYDSFHVIALGSSSLSSLKQESGGPLLSPVCVPIP
ncbi:hypothetical protein ACRALDRAFT_212305 [Sodiomyces alcalophilus JCM 7366]|uniref:uncharacterized protein n=1 Tax=Sodiomyces alcalophilus JCM 7366 TaxID=591952 RepID=UPI0039B53C59